MFLNEPTSADALAYLERDRAQIGYVMNLERAWAWRPDVADAFALVRQQCRSAAAGPRRGYLRATSSRAADQYREETGFPNDRRHTVKLRQLALHLPYCALGLLAATAATPLGALAHDERTQAATTQHHSGGDQRKKTNELVKIVRQVTAKYRDAEVAESDNYNLMFGCVSGDSSGAMGLHYVNLPLYMDGKIDAYQPEIVIYEPTPSGRPRLIGADYIVDAAAWDATHDRAPELNGQIFHYYSAPNRYGLNAFYTLHVWAWKDNPTGTFVNWHQNVSCDAHDGPNQ